MNLPALSVRRPITWIMLTLAVALFGTFSFLRLKMDMLPTLEIPVIAVITTWQGADPAGIEQLVTRPVEEALETAPGIREVTSTSSLGSSLVLALFEWGSDMRAAEQDVRKQLDISAIERLPDDAERPLVFAFDPSLSPVVFLTVNAAGSPERVRDIADDEIAPRLARLPGVAAAEVLGGAEREVQVQLDPEWLEAYAISPAQVVAAVAGADVQAPGGNIAEGGMEIGLVTDGELVSVEQLGDVVVGRAGGAPVRVRDVGAVVDTVAEATQVVRAEGNAAIMVAVRKQSDANTVQVVRAVRDELDALAASLPEDVEIGVMFDQAEPITGSLSNLASSAVVALFATGLVLLAFLRSWRTSGVVLVSIPLSMLVTFAVMDFQGVTLNIISMAGLALAVGMLVDNSIVVIENIFVRLDGGAEPATAAIEGTSEVMMPIVASTLTTLAVFVPILFVPGIAGQLFRDMALTICISLGASLIVTLTVVPLLASLGLRRRAPGAAERLVGVLTAWVDPVGRAYARRAPQLLRRPWLVLAVAFAFFVATLGTLPFLGFDFLPANDQAMIEYEVETAPGSSLAATDALFRQVEQIVEDEVPEAETISVQFGSAGGIFAITGANSNTGSLRVRLSPPSSRSRSQSEIEAVLRDRFTSLPGVEVRAQSMALGGSGDLTVRIALEDLPALRAYGSSLVAELEGLDGAGDVRFDLAEARTELLVGLDRDQLVRLGLTAGDVTGAISVAYMGVEAAMLDAGEDEIPVRVRANRASRDDVERIARLPITTPSGRTVPLSAVATVRTGVGPTAVQRADQERVGNVSISLESGSLGELTTAVAGVMAKHPPPPGATFEIRGAAEDLQESFMALGLAVLVAIVLVYMVMASQFESLIEPFVILATIPLALSGVLLGLLFTGTSFQVTALIGVVLLVGIVVNNGILLIEVLKQHRDAGRVVADAAGAAGRDRLRPILMTSLTTILGMLPLAFEVGQGSETWAPMARAVIGGMTVSTALTLFVVPAAYVVVVRISDRVAGRRAPGPVPQLDPEPTSSPVAG